MIRARITGTGHFLPETVYTNFDMEELCDTTDEWIRQRTGIIQRHIADAGWGVSDLMMPAARQALEMAQLDPMDLDMVVCATITPDHMLPATGSLIQDRLGAKNAGGFDVNAACSGFLYSLGVASSMIQSGMVKSVLICGGELVSNRINWKRRDTAVLFGDGAGAVVMQADDTGHGVLSMYLRSDGAGKEVLWVAENGSKEPLTHENFRDGRLDIQMKGPELFKRAVIEFSDSIKRAFQDSGVKPEELALFVPHQANERIMTAAAERAGIPVEKVVMNTVAASIPIALDQANRAGRIQKGDHVLFAGFGAGLTWGSAMVKW
jgi:3-oxoacyl-[acyl-carrier-protein] synthase-3